MRRLSFALFTGLLSILPAAVLAADDTSRDKFLIKGTISVPDNFAESIAPTDRLIIKLYHPGKNGLEMDATYRIMDRFTLPLDFAAGPAVGMSGSTKHNTYIVEVFTDKDQDVLSVVPDELHGQSEHAIRLGTSDIRLELKPRRQ